MTAEERQFLLTAAWLFARHGQGARARTLCEALVEDDARDGVAAVALAELCLNQADATAALDVLRDTVLPPALDRAGALLETRALYALGRQAEGERRWRRYLATTKGKGREWVTAS